MFCFSVISYVRNTAVWVGSYALDKELLHYFCVFRNVQVLCSRYEQANTYISWAYHQSKMNIAAVKLLK